MYLNKRVKELAKKIRDYVNHREQVKDRVKRFRTIFEKNTTLKEFDADVFESLIDRIIIGRINDDGSIDPYEVRFILKTGDELTDTLPIKKCLLHRLRKRMKLMIQTMNYTQRCVLMPTTGNTVIASPRGMIAVIENNVNEDGTINIPKALQPYMGGKKVISFKSKK